MREGGECRSDGSADARAALSVQGAYGALLERTHSEQGVSTAQYAFLVALMALVVALIVAFLGSGIRGLFGECAQLLERTYVRPHAR